MIRRPPRSTLFPNTTHVRTRSVLRSSAIRRGPRLASARTDVLVEVEDVVRVDGVLERGQPGQLLRRVGPLHALLSLVAEHVDVDPAGERLQAAGTLPGGDHRRLVLGRVGPPGGAHVLEPRAPL